MCFIIRFAKTWRIHAFELQPVPHTAGSLMFELMRSNNWRVDRLVISVAFFIICGAVRESHGLPVAGEPLSVAVTSGEFPPGDLKITREPAAPNLLILQFDNLDPGRLSGKAETQTFLVAGAAGVIPTIEVMSARYSRFVQGRALEDMDEVPRTIAGKPGIPAAVVRTADLGALRHLNVYTLSVVTSVMESEMGWQDASWVLRSLQLRITLGIPGMKNGLNITPQMAHSETEFLKSQVLNADISPEYWRPLSGFDISKEIDWSRLAAAASAKGQLYRFSVFAAGNYRIGPSELIKASQHGSPPQTGELSSWRVYRNGLEVPIVELGNSIVLPVAPNAFETPSEAVYWLITNSAANLGPLRLQPSEPAASENNEEQSASTTITLQSVAGPLEDYSARLHTTPTSTRWFWKSAINHVTALYPITLPATFSPDGPTSIEVQCGLANYGATFPTIRLFSNSVESGAATLASQQGSIKFVVPAGVFHPRENICGLRVEYPGEAAGQEVLVQSIRASWQQQLQVVPTGQFQLDSTSPSRTIMLPLPQHRSDAAPLLVGFANGTAIVLKSGLSQKKDVAAYDRPATATAFAFLSEELTTSVRNLNHVTSFKEIAPAEADYIAVAAPELMQPLQALLQQRQREGHTVLSRDVQSLFDQFTYGNRDGEAIRRFCKYLYANAASTAPLYLLLAGECSDYRGDLDLLPANCQPDMVPTIGPYVGEGMHGDQGYSQISGDDNLADIAVGRLSVTNAEELTGVIAKFEKYRTCSLGDWIYRAQFLLDDNEEFPRVAHQVIARSIAPPAELAILAQTDYTYVPNMRVPNRRRSQEATAAVVDEFNRGSAVQNFFGHGGPNLWSHERLFHIADLPLLHNAEKLPLITCLSCDNAWMDYPVGPLGARVGVSSSMGELLVRKADGGAIGLFGPVAGASPFEHQGLVSRLMEAIYRTPERCLGCLTAYSKNLYFAESHSAALPEQYVLLGDPALRLRIPQSRAGLRFLPAALEAGTSSVLQVQAPSNASARVAVRTMTDNDYLASETLEQRNRTEVSLRPDAVSAASIQWDPIPPDNGSSFANRIQVRPNSKKQTIASISKPDNASNLQITPAEVFASSGFLTAGESPALRFRVETSAKTSSTTLSAFLRTTSETISDTAAITALKRGKPQLFAMPLRQSLTQGEQQIQLVLSSTVGSHLTTETRTVKFNVAGPADLQFLPGTAHARSTCGFVQRATVFLDAVVRNAGAAPAKAVLLQALLDSPDTGTEAQSINESNSVSLDVLEPGEERSVTFRWENALEPGEKHVFLVLNKNRSIVESNYDNNYTTVPAFTVIPMGNFAVHSLENTPLVATAGGNVRVRAAVVNEGGTTLPATDVEVGLRNVQSDETSFTRTHIEALAPGTTATVDTSLIMDSRYNSVYATANPQKEYEELTLQDNTAGSDLLLAVPLNTLMPAAAKSISFSEIFPVCRTWNMDPISTNALQSADVFTSSSGIIPVDPKWFVSGYIRPSGAPFSQVDDNLWSFDFYKLEVGARENAGILTFRVPIASPDSPWSYDIYANLAGSSNFNGAPVGIFDAKFGQDQVWHHFDFTQKPGAQTVRRELLTSSTLDNGNLDIALMQGNGSAVLITSIEAVPMVSGIESPILLQDAGGTGSRVLRARSSGITEDKIWLQTRTGTLTNGTPAWEPWVMTAAPSVEIPESAPIFQWRVYLQADAGVPARLSDVVLEPK